MTPDAMAVRAVLSAVAVGLVLWRGLGPGGTRARLALRALLVASCLLGVGNYFGFDRRQLLEVRDYYDVTYYYLNSKYFDELGYFELYRAMLLADADGARRLDHIRVARDLTDYVNRPRKELMRGADTLREGFSAERWHAFTRDSDFLVSKRSPAQLDYFFKDHGYNATPSWTLLGSVLSSGVDVTRLKWITSVDLGLLLLMFVVLARSFGVEVMGFALLFFTCTHSGRWPVAGQALLRVDWLVALVTAHCALARGRYALSGALFGYAVQARLFPAVYLVPVALGWLAWGWHRRRLPREALHTLAGFAATLAVLCSAALLRYGADSFVDAARNLAMHAGAASYSSLRVGLADALVFRGERFWPMLGAAGGIPGKAAQVAALEPVTRLVALGVCALLAACALRRRPAPEALTPLGGLLLFALFNPQINYFNARLLWVPFHLAEPSRLRNLFGLGLLFLTEAVANAAHAAGAINYAVTSLSSVGLLLHMVGTCAFVALDLRAGAGAELGAAQTRGRTHPWLAALLLLGCATVFGGYWLAGARPPPEHTLRLERLAPVQPQGAPWDGAGCQVLGPGGLRVELGATRRAPRLWLSHDHDDHYELVFELRGEPVGRLRFGERGRGRRATLVHTTLATPRRALERGYDALRLLPLEGDARFSVGHLRLLN